MTFDLADHLGAMTRSVKNLERDGKPIKTVISPVFVWSLNPVPVKDAPTAAP